MALSGKYSCLVIVQFTLLFVDAAINSFGFLVAVQSLIAILVISILQDVVILALLVTLLLGFFNTFAFTVGLLKVIVMKFLWTIVIGLLYVLITLIFQIIFFTTNWTASNTLYWSSVIQAIYTIHKLIAVLFYYIYKRAIYRLSDKKLYSHSVWVKDQIIKVS